MNGVGLLKPLGHRDPRPPSDGGQSRWSGRGGIPPCGPLHLTPGVLEPLQVPSRGRFPQPHARLAARGLEYENAKDHDLSPDAAHDLSWVLGCGLESVKCSQCVRGASATLPRLPGRSPLCVGTCPLWPGAEGGCIEFAGSTELALPTKGTTLSQLLGGVAQAYRAGE